MSEKKDLSSASASIAHSAWRNVELARDSKRPTSRFYIEKIFDGFLEMHGDRYYADDGAIVGGIAWLNDIPVTVIAQEKGIDTNERIARNFGSPHPEGYRKSLRLMKQAEKFGRPIICLIDTQGAYCGLGAEERGQGRAIANNLMEMMALKTPTISVIISEGGSGGALAMAVADKIAVFENAIYSILSPEGFASILWKDSARAQEAADVMKLTADDLKSLGVIDDVLNEPEGAAQANPDKMAEMLKVYLLEHVEDLQKKETAALMEERYSKFRNMGRCQF